MKVAKYEGKNQVRILVVDQKLDNEFTAQRVNRQENEDDESYTRRVYAAGQKVTRWMRRRETRIPFRLRYEALEVDLLPDAPEVSETLRMW